MTTASLIIDSDKVVAVKFEAERPTNLKSLLQRTKTLQCNDNVMRVQVMRVQVMRVQVMRVQVMRVQVMRVQARVEAQI